MIHKIRLGQSVLGALISLALLAGCGGGATGDTNTGSAGNAGGSGATSGAPANTPASTSGRASPCLGQVGALQQLAQQPAPGTVQHTYSAPPPTVIDKSKTYCVGMFTTKGTILIELQPKRAPLTVNNFVFLVQHHFYDGLTFHRVVPDFVVQGGDPKGDGTGGPGYNFADEPVQGEYIAGAVAMANAGPNTNGSQFFIDTVDDRGNLQKLFNLFGQVAQGMDVVTKIQVGDQMQHVVVTAV